MIYERDFRTFPMRFPPRYNVHRSFSHWHSKRIKINVVTPSGKITKAENSDDDEQPKFLVKWFMNFCDNTSVHGMKFIGKSTMHWSERIIWLLLVITAIFGVIYVSLLLSEKFSNSPLSTVVESTIFPVSEIAYPAITICNHNRFNKERCKEAEMKYLPNATEETIEIFRLLMASMNSFEFGALDEFYEEIFNYTSTEISNLNLTEVFEFAMNSCEELFTGRCWWRNKYFECCENFFEIQRTEYGLCFSFNNAVNDIGKAKEANESLHYPLRTSNYGDWSGLRVELSTRTDISLQEELDGVIVIVHHPSQWPNSGYFVPSGSTTSIVIKPTYSYTTNDVRRLDPNQRQCLNNDESKSSLTLPGLKYLQMNCISECRQQYMQKYCGCSLSTFFPIGNNSDCNFEDLKCLFQFNDVFNYEKPPTGNPFFNDDDEGMECPCLPECNRVDYATEIAPNVVAQNDNMTIDFHYQSANIVKYRTDVTFGWLDLMVSFGGIAGLFLGCSILSGVEIIYYIFIIIFMLLKKLKKKTDKFLEKYSSRNQLVVQQNHTIPQRNVLKPDNIKVINIQTMDEIDKKKRNNARKRY